MVLLAIDLLNMQPFGRSKRIVLKPKMNCVVGPNGSGKTMIYQILSSILFNTSVKPSSSFENKSAQAALSFRTSQGDIFRVARDYQKAAWNLSRIETGAKKMTTIETEPVKIQDWLRKEAGGLSDKERHLLFLLDRFRLPSQTLSLSMDAVLPLPKFDLDEVQTPPDLAKDPFFLLREEARVETKREEPESESALKVAEAKLAAMEEESDLLLQKQDQIASLRNRMDQYREIELKLMRIEEAEARKYAPFASEKPIDANLLQAYEEDEKMGEQTLAALEEERETIVADLDTVIEMPLRKDPLLLSGLGLLAFSFLLPFVVTLAGPLRYIFLFGAFIGSGLAAFAYFKRKRQSAYKLTLRNNLAALDEKGKDAENRFETEHKEVVDFIQMTGVKNLAELKGVLLSYAGLMKKKKTVQSEKENFLKDHSIEEMEAELSLLEKDSGALEEKLATLEAVSQEVYRLQEVLREGDSGGDLLEENILQLAVPSEETDLNFFSALLSIETYGGGRPDRQRLQQNASQVFRFFQSGATETIHLKENGEVFVGETPLNRLSAGIADQVFFSLVLSALEQFAELSVPLLLDDPFAHFDARSKSFAGKILQEISKKRQVLLFTADALSSCKNARFVNLSPNLSD